MAISMQYQSNTNIASVLEFPKYRDVLRYFRNVGRIFIFLFSSMREGLVKHFFVVRMESTPHDQPIDETNENTITFKRKPTSTTWHFFNYINEENTSSCILCEKKITGKVTTNLKKHLERAHPNDLRIHEKEKELQGGNEEIDLTKEIIAMSKYLPSNQKQIDATSELALLVGSSNIPNNIVEHPRFVKFCMQLNARYEVPTRYLMDQRISEIKQTIDEKIFNKLKNAKRITVGTDIWTKKSLSSSYIGVIAFFYDKEIMKNNSCLLTVKEFFTSSHTAEACIEMMKGILDNYGIEKQQLFRIISDNGSNMVKAFKDNKDIFDNESDSIDSDEDEIPNWDIEDEIANFEEEEEKSNLVAISGNYKRLSCFVHKLQCCVRIIDKDVDIKNAMSEAFRICKKVNSSHPAEIN